MLNQKVGPYRFLRTAVWLMGGTHSVSLALACVANLARVFGTVKPRDRVIGGGRRILPYTDYFPYGEMPSRLSHLLMKGGLAYTPLDNC